MITLEKVLIDIRNGKSTMIYYSANTLWWTHLEEDLKQATEQGREAQKRQFDAMMSNPFVPASEKQRFKFIYEKAGGVEGLTIPVDPSGSPLYQMDDPLKWVMDAYAKPEHFKRHGLDAFMKTHHRNCEGICFLGWMQVNDHIDQQLAATKWP